MKTYMFTETTTYKLFAESPDEAEKIYDQWCEDNETYVMSVVDVETEKGW
jgi:hypothetical protein